MSVLCPVLEGVTGLCFHGNHWLRLALRCRKGKLSEVSGTWWEVSLGAERKPWSLLLSQGCPGTLTLSSIPTQGDLMRSLSHLMGFQAGTDDKPWRDRLPGRALTWQSPRDN